MIPEDGKGYPILEAEVEKALKGMRKGKTCGIDDMPAELLKYLENKARKGIVYLCNEIYNKGEWPEDFLATVMIPIEKEKHTKKCEAHRTVSLISCVFVDINPVAPITTGSTFVFTFHRLCASISRSLYYYYCYYYYCCCSPCSFCMVNVIELPSARRAPRAVLF